MTSPAARQLGADDEAQLLDAIDKWIERDLKPIVREYDHADRYPAHVVEQMKEFGLFGATVGTEYGGLGLPATTYAKLVMRISAGWMSITGIFNSHLMLAFAIERFGTPAQKAQWLPKLKAPEQRALAADSRFADGNTRDRHRQELTAARDPIFRRRTTATWLERLAGVCPVAPVYDVAQALDSPFVAASGTIRDVPHSKQDLRLLTSPIKIDDERAELVAAPALGADNARLLRSR